MVEVIMPKMGDAMEEGTLVEWLKKEGEKVKSGDIIGNIQTDKATVELTAPSSGVLSGLIGKPGDTVPVGKPIAAILKEGEKLPEGWGNGSGQAAATKSEPAVEEKPQEQSKEPAPKSEPDVQEKPQEQPKEPGPAPKAQEQPPAPRPSGRVIASPLARSLAAEAGLDLAALRGTGPNGRIVERDVRAALAEGKPSAPQQPAQEDRLVPLTNLQRITADRTAHSKAAVPHYYVTVEADVEALETLRRQMNEEAPDTKLSLNDFIVKACALALQAQPHINAAFENGQRREFASINIGIAAAVPDGLTLPVIKNCQSKSLRQMAAETRTLVAKARDNKLTLDELTGSTFAISNMGMFEVESFSAIINEPNGAIVAVSTAKRVPVVTEGDELEIRTRMKVTGSFDHRIIDGAIGAKFMMVLREFLENPTRLLS